MHPVLSIVSTYSSPVDNKRSLKVAVSNMTHVTVTCVYAFKLAVSRQRWLVFGLHIRKTCVDARARLREVDDWAFLLVNKNAALAVAEACPCASRFCLQQLSGIIRLSQLPKVVAYRKILLGHPQW